MRKHPSFALVFIAVLFLVPAPLMAGFAGSTSLCQLTVYASVAGARVRADGVQSTTQVHCVPENAIVNSPINCTATVYGSNPTGTVAWNTNSSTGYFDTLLPALFDGSCSVTYYDSGAGSVNISASYGGDANNLPSSGSDLLVLFRQFQLMINGASGGSTSPSPGGYMYNQGDNTIVSASPDPTYQFSYWLLDGNNFGSQNPTTITMDDNHIIQPVFAQTSNKFNLTITTQPGGTTNPSPGTYVYSYSDTSNAVEALGNTGFFDHWIVDGSTQIEGSPITIQQVIAALNQSLQTHTLLAVFAPSSQSQFQLIINSASEGTTQPPYGTQMYSNGSKVTVTATPAPGYQLANWLLDGNDFGNQNPTTIKMNSNHTLQPIFMSGSQHNQFHLTINQAPGGTTNPPNGTQPYNSGATATVMATPGPGYHFDHWILDGNNFGSQNPITIPMNSDHTAEPVFVSGPPTEQFQLTIGQASGGTANPPPGTYTYNGGDSATVAASPNNGGNFAYWILDGNQSRKTLTQNPITIPMGNNHTLQPVFTGNQGNPGQGGQVQSLNIPPDFILIGAVAIIACFSVGYLAPLALAMRKGLDPASVKKTRLILALVSILIIAGPLGVTLLAYSGNLSGVFSPSNVDKLTNMLSNQGGMMMPNVTSAWYNLTSRTFGMLFNFTNPTATDLTLIAFSANLMDHSDGYPLGQISLANPMTAGANETVMFPVTCTLAEEAAGHVATAFAGANSVEVDLSNVNINLAGIMLQMNGTSTINNLSIVT